jgi:hypothetical protein
VTSKTGSDVSSENDDGKALMIANVDVDPKDEWEDSVIIAAGEEWKLEEESNESIGEYEYVGNDGEHDVFVWKYEKTLPDGTKKIKKRLVGMMTEAEKWQAAIEDANWELMKEEEAKYKGLEVSKESEERIENIMEYEYEKFDEDIEKAIKEKDTLDWKPPEPEYPLCVGNPKWKWTYKRPRSQREIMYEKIYKDADKLTEKLDRIWSHKNRMDRRLATKMMQDMKMRLGLEAEGKECIKDKEEVWYVVPPKPRNKHKRSKSN